jgi:hypothetical protein
MIYEQEGAHHSSPAGPPPVPISLTVPSFLILRNPAVIPGSGLRGPGSTLRLTGWQMWFKGEGLTIAAVAVAFYPMSTIRLQGIFRK